MIHNLPEEIIDRIFSHLCVTADLARRNEDQLRLSTLASIARSSKTLNRIVEHHLYQTIDCRTHIDTTRLRQFIRALLYNPDAASHVQQIRLQDWDVGSRGLILIQESDGPEELALGGAALVTQIRNAMTASSLPMDLKDDLQNMLSNDPACPDAELALLLVLCTNARHLDIVCDVDIPSSFVLRVAEAVHMPSSHADKKRPLEHLSELHVAHSDTEGHTSIADVHDLLQLPRLRTFRGHMLACDQLWPLPRTVRSPVKRIFLQYSLLDHLGLESILQACPSLTTLSVEWAGSTVGECCIDMNMFGQTLRTFGANLEVIRLKPEMAACFDESHDHRTSIGSMASLASLRELTAPYTTFFGREQDRPERYPQLAEILPESLRLLRMVDHTADDPDILDDQLWALMQDERHKQLKTIRINRGAPFSYYAEDIGWDESESNQFWVVLKRI
ncbi:uncharacterized protein MYCFIDRAFT_196315 [Pseudocercospora fijiensis CIRAD86]|uniref:F-box domain-containing protein n=1 Tax=Pseudocercospora fijiensis (strain CIRAD86) TaxID=383855 RepID=M3AE80_PSEFD|nr:uncharacterized protein MYCFIDRAFT_196315 [Pseudocercospora fijiensis CIRAD86]EME82876.1 hypothetical protein MYCFIDRAFT_196315 [Pseudocercospora fijiensis CIRAD86]